MAKPVRVRLSRRRGWRMPENTVKVDRSTRWGNPCSHEPPADRRYAVDAFRAWIDGDQIGRDLYGPPPPKEEIRSALAGKNLACWCPLDEPCHASVLLAVANDDGSEMA